MHNVIGDAMRRHHLRAIDEADIEPANYGAPADDGWRPPEHEPDGPHNGAASEGGNMVVTPWQGPLPPLTIAEWRARDLPDPDFVSGYWFTTTSRAMLVAPTGLGKTNFAMALAMSMAAAMDFLHWRGGNARRVLFVDGEMSRRLLKRRVLDCARRLGFDPPTFFALSREDLENFKPLNTPEGQADLLRFIQEIGGVDVVIFDNIMSLTAGDMKETQAWAQTLPLVLRLTRDSIGQLWIHHTGHDENRSYGDKTKEWQLDTVMHMEEAKRDDTDLSFILQFRKARERMPETRDDFRDVKIALVDDVWTYEAAEGSRPGKVPDRTMKFLTALQNVLAGDEAVPFKNRKAAAMKAWQAECELLGLIDKQAKPGSARALFSRHRLALVAANLVACQDDLAWTIR